MRSPTEITKFTLSSEIVGKLGDLSGELFVPCSLPEPPKQNFLKGLIGGVNTRSLDREELCKGQRFFFTSRQYFLGTLPQNYISHVMEVEQNRFAHAHRFQFAEEICDKAPKNIVCCY